MGKTNMQAIDILKQGGVVAYPTESCFGLGCDPHNTKALEKILTLKKRIKDKGLILIAANIEQAQAYVDFSELSLINEIKQSWPGPNTWLLPPLESLPVEVKNYICGTFPLLAVRVTAHPVANELCLNYGGAIVSTSANLAGQSAATTTQQVRDAFGNKVDYIVDDVIGQDTKPSTIRDGLTGQILRA